MILSEFLESHHFLEKYLQLEMLQPKVEMKELDQLELTGQTPFY